LVRRKSLMLGMLASGVVLANAARPSAAVAASVPLTVPPLASAVPGSVPWWTPSTAYELGQQVISPNNDVASANVAHTSSASYVTDTAKWTLSTTYERRGVAVRPTTPRAEPVTTMVSNAGILGHGWVIGGGSAAGSVIDLNDPTPGLISTQSVKVTTNGLGGAGRVDRSGLTADLSGRSLVLWLTVDDPSKLKLISLYFGSAGLASEWQWDIEASYDQFFLAGVPARITVPFTAFGSVTGSPDRGALAFLRLHVQDRSTGPVTVRLSGIGAQVEPVAGACVFTWDDSYAVQLTAQRILDRHAMPSTFYTIADAVGQPGSLSLAQLQALQSAGSEVACHAFTTAAHNTVGGFTGLTADALEAEYIGIKEWAVSNGFRGLDHLAYPQGKTSDMVLAMTRRYFTSARTTLQRGKETMPPADPHRIRIRGLDNGTTLELAKAYVDVAKASKSLVVFTGHKIGAVTDSLTWVDTDLVALTDYIAAQGLAVKTMSAALR
jgi:peptidoglycan/xylan/chitin deacetylase (PgdA/CDA1 family)